jgi:hypothetical protein
MNERIKLLALDCYNPYSNFDHEKFAGLIVKECTDVLNKRFVGDLNREDMEVRRCIADVNKHFGIHKSNGFE